MEPDGTSARDELERAILGGGPVFNALEVAAETGVTLEQAQRLWRALGFPEHGAAVAYTRGDVGAVSTLLSLVESGLLDFDLAAAGEAALDLANLLVHLELRALQGVCDAEVARAAAGAVLAGYRPGPDVRRRLAVYDEAARRRLVAVYAFRPASGAAARRLLPGPARRAS